MEYFIRITIVLALILISDLLVYYSIRTALFRNAPAGKWFKILFWSLPVAFFIFTAVITIVNSPVLDDHIKYRQNFWVLGIFVLLYVPKMGCGLLMLTGMIIHGISRLVLRNKSINILRYSAWAGLWIMAATFIYTFLGFTYFKTDFRVRSYTFESRDLPQSFNGIRLVHVSDMHLGSFTTQEQVLKGIEHIRSLKPDIIVFSGDMINVSDKEILPYKDALASLDAPMGKYSVLGNHDMGDYLKSADVPTQNVITAETERLQQLAGITVLRDTSVTLKRGNDSINICGVDNWGLSPFKQRGKLLKALHQSNADDFVILLSHDPSHWRAEILNDGRADLTLSGHTHGMQIGIRIGGFQWSPAAVRYPEWAGMYLEKGKAMHVSPGFGFGGFPARIGIRPEITLIELRHQ